MRRSVELVLVLTLTGATNCSTVDPDRANQSGNPDELESLAWLTGSWVSKSGADSSEEHWTAPRGGSMLGMNRTVKGSKTAFFEYVRIENTPDGIVYLAHPKARSPATTFRMVETAAQRAVFENLQHDNPQRVIYWRMGDTLRARTEGMEGGQPAVSEWKWQRVG